MNQLLKRRSEAEHAIKDLESLYTQTVVKTYPFIIPRFPTFCVSHCIILSFLRSLLQISERESQTNTAGSVSC